MLFVRNDVATRRKQNLSATIIINEKLPATNTMTMTSYLANRKHDRVNRPKLSRQHAPR
jgi:hypothetical protein